MRPLPARLLLVTDRHASNRPLLRTIDDALRGGLKWVWLRDRDLPREERFKLAERLMATTRGSAILSIGGTMDLALQLGVNAVHLQATADLKRARDRLGADALIGVSAHNISDVRRAVRDGADYATLSPVFASPSKPGYGPALGLQGLRAAAGAGLPILALGGIVPADVLPCLQTGARGVAVMGQICCAENPRAAVETFLTNLAKG